MATVPYFSPPVLPSAEAVGLLPLYGGGGIRPEISAY